jgi:hypothetical protein
VSLQTDKSQQKSASCDARWASRLLFTHFSQFFAATWWLLLIIAPTRLQYPGASCLQTMMNQALPTRVLLLRLTCCGPLCVFPLLLPALSLCPFCYCNIPHHTLRFWQVRALESHPLYAEDIIQTYQPGSHAVALHSCTHCVSGMVLFPSKFHSLHTGWVGRVDFKMERGG